MPQKIAYIDYQNVYKGIQALGREIDRRKFFVYLKEQFRIDKIKLFIGYIEGKEMFYNKLEEFGYELIYKITQPFTVTELINNKRVTKTIIKGNVDSELIVEAMRDYYEQHLDIGYLVSGDGDFTVLVKFRQEKDVLGKLFVPNARKTSFLLIQTASKRNVYNMKSLQYKISR